MLVAIFVRAHVRSEHFNGDREDDGGVFLSGNRVQCMQVTKLQRRRRLGDHFRCFFAVGANQSLKDIPCTTECSRTYSARLALCSPSAAITLARASRAASASAAIARCSCTGKRTSLLLIKSRSVTYNPFPFVCRNSHFHPLHFDSPRVRGIVQRRLNHVAD